MQFTKNLKNTYDELTRNLEKLRKASLKKTLNMQTERRIVVHCLKKTTLMLHTIDSTHYRLNPH